MSFTLPFTAKHTGTYAQAVEFATVAVVDNSSVTGTPGLAVVNVSGTPAVDLYKTSNSNGTWTASNVKQCAGYLVYQVQ